MDRRGSTSIRGAHAFISYSIICNLLSDEQLAPVYALDWRGKTKDGQLMERLEHSNTISIRRA